MLNLDMLVVPAIVVAAAVYLYRQFFAAKKGSGCSCSTAQGCSQKK